MKEKIPVVIELGGKLSFASAKNWPGFSRSGKDAAEALERLAAYAPRYASVLQGTNLDFPKALKAEDFKIVFEVNGGTATDFGVPSMAWPDDEQLPDTAEAQRWLAILDAAWKAFDQAAQAAQGKQLQQGPRGGGRNLDRMSDHVREAEQGYMVSLGGKLSPRAKADWSLQREEVRAAFIEAMNGNLPKIGPRGGKRWPARYFIRRSVWHLLDHAWELEDRSLDQGLRIEA